MNILHISAECYPLAKVGGLADVVGALPKYLQELNTNSSVIMPYYNTAFTKKNSFKEVYKNTLQLGNTSFEYSVLLLPKNVLGFDLFCVNIPNLLYQDYVYSNNDTERFLAFQIATLDWIITLDKKPDLIHTHDHHTGLIPFMISECYKYNR